MAGDVQGREESSGNLMGVLSWRQWPGDAAFVLKSRGIYTIGDGGQSFDREGPGNHSRSPGGYSCICGNCCRYTYFIGMADPYYWYMKLEELRFGTELLKRGFASMQKGGVIMDVVNAEQARIAETAGAVAVMSLERVPSDIRKQGGVARMADPEKVKEIIDAVSIPVMGKVRIGHFVEAQGLEELGVDMIDESEVLDSCRRRVPHRQETVQGPVCLRSTKPW